MYLASLIGIIYFLQLCILHILKTGNKLGVVDDIPNPLLWKIIGVFILPLLGLMQKGQK